MTSPQTNVKILCGDALEMLRTLPDESVQCCVTSPPYWGLRDYKSGEKEIGLESTLEQYIDNLLSVFGEVLRVLKGDGVLWLNIGDAYAGSGKGGNPKDSPHQKQATNKGSIFKSTPRAPKDCKPKDLIGIPWLLAFSLRAQGWYLRSDIIWAKPNCMPESVTDRPTRSHEYLFLLSKSAQYFYDADAIKEPCVYDTADQKANRLFDGTPRNGFKDAAKFNGKNGDKQRGHSRRHAGFNARWDAMPKDKQCSGMRNKRDVWTVSPAQYSGEHFAVYPPALIKPCIMAGSRPGDTILDPFAGSGTTGQVASELGRSAILIELNPDHVPLIQQRMATVTPGLQLT